MLVDDDIIRTPTEEVHRKAIITSKEYFGSTNIEYEIDTGIY